MTHFENFTKTVRERLSRVDRGQVSFMSLTAVGELLRRACNLEEAPSATAQAALEEYDASLARYDAPEIGALRAEIDELFVRLAAYAALPVDERVDTGIEGDVVDDGHEILVLIDATLGVVAAGVRAGFYDRSELTAMSAVVTERLGCYTGTCVEQAQRAEDFILAFGNDPLYAEAYGWWEMFARLAPSRMAVAAIVGYATDRQRRIENAMIAYDPKITQGQ